MNRNLHVIDKLKPKPLSLKKSALLVFHVIHVRTGKQQAVMNIQAVHIELRSRQTSARSRAHANTIRSELKM